MVSKICLNQLKGPCVFYSLNGFYDNMKMFLQRMVESAFPWPNVGRVSISCPIWLKSSRASTRTTTIGGCFG